MVLVVCLVKRCILFQRTRHVSVHGPRQLVWLPIDLIRMPVTKSVMVWNSNVQLIVIWYSQFALFENKASTARTVCDTLPVIIRLGSGQICTNKFEIYFILHI